MKLNKRYLKRIIQEEISKLLQEGEFGRGTSSLPFIPEEATHNEKALYMRAAEAERDILGKLKEIDDRLSDLEQLADGDMDSEQAIAAGVPE